ncbi:MAG TPA: type II toxin-antitoxin system VapC family toxin [Ilumatobacteraceae bacterium]|nr:type II toxin-antitoxin system VapC family toxin [Ilumatobacteraceae bacterium]
MLVVDASVLFEVVADTPHSELLRQRLAADTDQVAPHLIDAEVLAVIQAKHRRGVIDLTAASQAVDDLAAWPGERWSHRPLLDRVWQLRDNVRAYDALYVALAEALDATLLTLDRRLAAAPGLRCAVEIGGG